jgi:hypothetical protein
MKPLLYAIFVLCIASCARSNMDSLSDGSVNDNTPPTNMTQTKLLPEEYVGWVEAKENGLKKEKTIEDIKFTAQYKPYQYVICEEARTNALPDTTFKKKTGELNGMQYYNLRIEVKDGNGELLKYGVASASEYKQRVNYFSFGMQNDIKLVEGNDTLPCLLYHYERAYDVVPYGTFLLAFPLSKNSNSDRTLIFFDRGFNKGIIKFFYRGVDINNQPQLQVI